MYINHFEILNLFIQLQLEYNHYLLVARYLVITQSMYWTRYWKQIFDQYEGVTLIPTLTPQRGGGFGPLEAWAGSTVCVKSCLGLLQADPLIFGCPFGAMLI